MWWTKLRICSDRSNINVCYYWDFHVWWTKLRICSDRSNINVCYYWDFHVWWTKLRICSEATSMFAIIEIFMCDGSSWESAQKQHQCLLLLRFSWVMDQAENLLRSNINVCYYRDFHVWWTKLRICSKATSMFAIIEIFMSDGPR